MVNQTEGFILLDRLDSPDDIGDGEAEFGPYKGGIQGENLSPSTSIWAWMCLGSSLVLLLLSIALHIPLDTVTSRTDDRTTRLFKTNNLYRPNMYIGLERLNTTISRMALPEKLDVFPHVFAPVSKRYPDLVYPSNGRSRITFNGLVSPGEPHIIINKDVSMIAQIRVQDYNMGKCSFASVIPHRSELLSQNRTLTLMGSPTRLDVWELDSSEGEIDLSRLSRRTSPARKFRLSSVTVGEGRQTQSEEFDCGVGGMLRTFEFACSEDGVQECSIDFYQEQPETQPRMALLVVQFPSV